MIRVGGDYQAQIPEFKPGKLGGRKAQQKETTEGIKIDDKEREGGNNLCVSCWKETQRLKRSVEETTDECRLVEDEGQKESFYSRTKNRKMKRRLEVKTRSCFHLCPVMQTSE